VGVDWGSNGWVCACLDGSEWSVSLEPSILSVWRRYGEGIDGPLLVDIPIGLVAAGARECDRAAKSAMAAHDRGASVFLTPPRPALRATTYEEAKAATEARTDGSLTVQAWRLLPRVQEVDDLLQSAVSPGRAIRESHPEVCFHALADGDGLGSKHDAAGADARAAVLDAHVTGAAAAYEDLVASHIDDQPSHARRFRAGNDDDILDAMCLAVTARVGTAGEAGGDAALSAGFERFGGRQSDPVLDRPVEIVYADP
jgi:predicted RNase H-like nuclease